jgi:hypothetical protein
LFQGINAWDAFLPANGSFLSINQMCALVKRVRALVKEGDAGSVALNGVLADQC